MTGRAERTAARYATAHRVLKEVTAVVWRDGLSGEEKRERVQPGSYHVLFESEWFNPKVRWVSESGVERETRANSVVKFKVKGRGWHTVTRR